jgi:hypothetical protein
MRKVSRVHGLNERHRDTPVKVSGNTRHEAPKKSQRTTMPDGSVGVCFPFFKAMRKAAKFEWTEECTNAFEKVKQYLANPPRLSRPTAGDTLVLYLATTGHAVSAALVKEEGKEQMPIYFVSHVLRDAEARYTQIEKRRTR